MVWQSWEQHEIFALLVKRINPFLGDRPTHDLMRYSQPSLAKYLEPVFESRFSGAGHWSNAPTYRVLMSLTRKRPRDLVKLCSLAARNARLTNSSVIRTRNLENVFAEYSQGRIQDTINEFRSELPGVERLLFGMKPTKKERTTKAGYVYTTDALFRKLRAIQEQGQFRFATGRVASEKELAAFLYKVNFLTARKELAELIDRKYFEESRYLQSSFADFGYDWEIHPAYRWALQPDDLQSIFDSLRLSVDT